ncbi:MAG: excinuclease ABC subunit UvrC, partial [Clostridia bacterium]|nr:excinuclease ABC subunit UvrC [Clostridia bacterium]
MRVDLEQKIRLLPKNPGVYVMLGQSGEIIYVGKAKNLKNRVTQYFYDNVKTDKVMAMVSCITDFYYIITNSEADALSLENNLIKKNKPKYNILLKDDKTYPYIKIDLKKPFPRFEIVRRIAKDGARYFGPFMGGINAKEIIEIINSAFLLRSCTQNLSETGKKRECLQYHIKRCLGPCNNHCTREQYLEKVNGALDFLSGNDDEAEKILSEKMFLYSENEEFELALSYRDKLNSLKKIREKKITSLNRFISCDVIAIASDNIHSAINVLITRGGRMQGGKHFAFEDGSVSPEECLENFITRFYDKNNQLPDEIIVNLSLEGEKLIEEYFKNTFGKKVTISTAKQGVRKQLCDMAELNARDYLEKSVDKIRHKEDMTVLACERLKKILGLAAYPKRMECYDISNISGVDKVGSMVVFIDGEKAADEYRRFKIKTVEGADDFASLKEVLTRRIARMNEEPERFAKPELIIIDGGKGQLSAVKEVFDELGVSDIELISLAKKQEEIFTLTASEPIILQRNDYCLRMLQRIRDEALRFAITYHR